MGQIDAQSYCAFGFFRFIIEKTTVVSEFQIIFCLRQTYEEKGVRYTSSAAGVEYGNEKRKRG